MTSLEHGDPQTHPQKVTPDPWAGPRPWLEECFRVFGGPDGLVVYRMDTGDSFGPRYPVDAYHFQPGRESRKGRPVAYGDPAYHYAQKVATLRKYHPDAPTPDTLMAELLSVSVRTIEGWRADGLIGGGRKRSA